MFSFPLTHLHTRSVTFTTHSVQHGWITAKSTQTWFPDSPHLMTRSQNTTQQRESTLWAQACYFIIFSSLWFNLFFLAFFLECLLPACENGVYIDELGPDIDFPSLWCGHFLVYYTTLAAYSHSSCKLDIWTTWPWQYGDNEISLMTLSQRFYRHRYRLPAHVQ